MSSTSGCPDGWVQGGGMAITLIDGPSDEDLMEYTEPWYGTPETNEIGTHWG